MERIAPSVRLEAQIDELLSLCWAVLDLFLAGAHGLGLVGGSAWLADHELAAFGEDGSAGWWWGWAMSPPVIKLDVCG